MRISNPPASDQLQQASTEKSLSNSMVYRHGTKPRSGDQLGRMQKWICEL